jgi:hypothetical protein
MHASDRARFKGLMEALASAFRAEPTTAFLEGYWLGLEDMTTSDFEAAAKRALRECKFMPSVFELRSLTGEMPAAVRAVSAWLELLKGIRRHGAWYSVDFEDKLINATVRSLGGWREVCAKESDELHVWTKKEFERLYGLLAQRGEPQGEEALYLAGQFEVNNGASGHAIDPPKRIPMTTLRPMVQAKPPRLVSIPAPGKDDKEAG